tara:strand:- start:2235 stop:2486 length:252 start_codon:yes stop_codon:yes gene_type:complete
MQTAGQLRKLTLIVQVMCSGLRLKPKSEQRRSLKIVGAVRSVFKVETGSGEIQIPSLREMIPFHPKTANIERRQCDVFLGFLE